MYPSFTITPNSFSGIATAIAEAQNGKTTSDDGLTNDYEATYQDDLGNPQPLVLKFLVQQQPQS